MDLVKNQLNERQKLTNNFQSVNKEKLFHLAPNKLEFVQIIYIPLAINEQGINVFIKNT